MTSRIDNGVQGLGGTFTLRAGSHTVSPTMSPRNVFENILSFLGRAVGMAGGSVSRGSLGIDNQYSDLIGAQMEMQRQMMIVSMVSNVIKSEHETKMAAVRNVRVG